MLLGDLFLTKIEVLRGFSSLPFKGNHQSQCQSQVSVRPFVLFGSKLVIDCPFCQDGLLGLGVGYEDGMLNGCDSERCGACIET